MSIPVDFFAQIKSKLWISSRLDDEAKDDCSYKDPNFGKRVGGARNCQQVFL